MRNLSGYHRVVDTKNLVNRRTRRTTLTLEADVVDYVEQKLAADKRLREKTVINDLLRKGIRIDEARETKAFRPKPFKTHLASGMTLRKLEEIIDEV